MSDKIKAVIISPSKVITMGLHAILKDSGRFIVKDTLTDITKENEKVLGDRDTGLIIIDPIIFPYSAIPTIRHRLSEITDATVVAVSHTAVGEDMRRHFDESISVYDRPNYIIDRLRAALSHENEMSATSDTSSGQEKEDLSQREKEILVCVAKGMLNKEIADRLSLSVHTVITHRKNITRKTGIKTVAGLTVYALLNNLIDPSQL